VNALDEVAQVGNVHLACDYLRSEAQFLEHDRAQLNDAQRRLAPGDDGVDTRTVSVVRTDSAVSVAVQRRGVTAGPTLSLTGDQIHEWIELCLLGGLGGFHG
jgi:hypothetical protein